MASVPAPGSSQPGTDAATVARAALFEPTPDSQRASVRGVAARAIAGSIPARRFALPMLDVLAASLAVYGAVALRFDDPTPMGVLVGLLPLVAMPLVVRPLLNQLFGLYDQSWRYVSVPELLRLLVATVVGTLFMVAIFIVLSCRSASRWWLPTNVLAARGWLEPRADGVHSPGAADTRRHLEGTITSGSAVANDHVRRRRGRRANGSQFAAREPSAGVLPVAFLDDDPAKWGRIHAGIRVRGGLDQLARRGA